MDGEAKRKRVDIPVACDMSALTAEQQERQRAMLVLLRADAEEVRELDDGYAFRHSADREVLLALAEFGANERLCCPFFGFAIAVERGGGPVWLRMTGEGDQGGTGGGDGPRRLRALLATRRSGRRST